MTLPHLALHSFLAVYRSGSQTKAAQELFLTQPAISQHIKMLEKYIGRPLFMKAGKYLKPTAAAHQLAFTASAPLDALAAMWANVKPSLKTDGGIVYLGGIAEFFSTVIAPHLATLNQHGIQLRFEIGHDILLEKLLQGELDLAQFCSHVVHPGVTIERLFHQQYYLVGAPIWKNKMSQKELKKGETTMLDKLPWIAYDESLLFIKEYYQAFFNKTFTGRVALMVKDLWSVQAAVVGGLGVTVLPSYFCQEYLKNKKLVLLHQPKIYPHHYFYLGWKDGALRNPRVQWVRKILHFAASKKSL